MQGLGIICEYNPFHNGHLYQIERVKSMFPEKPVVIALSGSFTQRCEPAAFSKLARAEMALKNGADLVLEIPFIYSTSSAEGFALGGVGVLNSLGLIDTLCFGSECGDIDKLRQIAEILDTKRYRTYISQNVNMAAGFAQTRQKAVAEILGDEYGEIIRHPNNILTVEYIKQVIRLNTGMDTVAIKRKAVGHDSDVVSGKMASASYIRKLISAGKDFKSFVPESSYEVIIREFGVGRGVPALSNIERAVIFKLANADKKDLQMTPEISEGLENRIIKAARGSAGLDEMINRLKTKRYPVSRLRRAVLWAFMDIENDFRNVCPPYVRVLGFNGKGSALLKAAKKSATAPIITKPAHAKEILDGFARVIFDTEAKATDLWNLCLDKAGRAGEDLTFSPVKMQI